MDLNTDRFLSKLGMHFRQKADAFSSKEPTFSDVAIQTVLTLRMIYPLSLVGQAEGFVNSVLAQMGLGLHVPDYSTRSRRQADGVYLSLRRPRGPST